MGTTTPTHTTTTIPSTTTPTCPECWEECTKTCGGGISRKSCKYYNATGCESEDDCVEKECNTHPCPDQCIVGPSIKVYFDDTIPSKMYKKVNGKNKEVKLGDAINVDEIFYVSQPCGECKCNEDWTITCDKSGEGEWTEWEPVSA